MKIVMNLTKKGLLALVALTLLMSGMVIAHAKGSGGSIGNIIRDNVYDITLQFQDPDGETIQPDEVEEFTDGSGETYTKVPPTIPDYIFDGYYVVDPDGNKTGPFTVNPNYPRIEVETKDDASDTENGRGHYDVILEYVEDKNNNDIPDSEETFIMTEFFEDEDEVTVPNSPASRPHAITGVAYNYAVPDIHGYKPVGYYFTSIAGADPVHAGGAQGSPMAFADPTNPVVSINPLQSRTGAGAYDVHIVYAIDPEDWATLTYDKGADTATGTMTSETVLKGTQQVVIKDSAFTNGDLDFLGWSVDNDNSVDPGYEVGTTRTLSEDLTLYAIWEEGTITANFHNSETTDVVNPEGFSMSVPRNASFQAPAGYRTANPQWHKFLGWSTTDDNTVDFDPLDPSKNIIPTGNTDMDLYAVWGYIYYSDGEATDKQAYTDKETINYTYEFNNEIGTNALTLYDFYAEMEFVNGLAIYEQNSITGYVVNQATGVQTPIPATAFSYNDTTKKVRVDLAELKAGESVELSFRGKANITTGETVSDTIKYYADGEVFPSTRGFSLFKAARSNRNARVTGTF